MNNVLSIVMLFQAGSQQGGSSLWTFMPFIAIFLIMYLLILRPQSKKQKQHQAMVASVKKGDKIITAGGIYGVVSGVKEKENTLLVKIDDNVKVEISRSSVAKKLE